MDLIPSAARRMSQDTLGLSAKCNVIGHECDEPGLDGTDVSV